MHFYHDHLQDVPTSGYTGEDAYRFTRMSVGLHDAFVERRAAVETHERLKVASRRLMHALGWNYAGQSWDGSTYYAPAWDTRGIPGPGREYPKHTSEIGEVVFDEDHRLQVVFWCRLSFTAMSEMYPQMMEDHTPDSAWAEAEAAGFGSVEWTSEGEAETATVPVEWLIGWQEDLPYALRTHNEVLDADDSVSTPMGRRTVPAETGTRPLVSTITLMTVQRRRLINAFESVRGLLEELEVPATSPMVDPERIDEYRDALHARGDLVDWQVEGLTEALRCAEVYIGGNPRSIPVESKLMRRIGDGVFRWLTAVSVPYRSTDDPIGSGTIFNTL